MTVPERDIDPAALSLPPTLQVTVPIPVTRSYERERIAGEDVAPED